jgi:hypothetical protein
MTGLITRPAASRLTARPAAFVHARATRRALLGPARYLAAIAALFAATSSHAILVTLDADDFAPGTNVSNLLDGVAIRRVSRTPGSTLYGDVNVTACSSSNYCGSYDGLHQFGGNFWEPFEAGRCVAFNQGCGGFYQSFNALEIALAAPTDYVSMQTHMLSDAPGVAVLTSEGTLFNCMPPLSSQGCSWTRGPELSDGFFWTVEITVPEKSIERVWFGAPSGASRVGQITVNVPEPATLALFAAALLGFGFTSRRSA